MKFSFKKLLVFNLIYFGVAGSIVAKQYVPPANHRKDINLDSGWRFIRQDVAAAQSTNFDDTTWAKLSLPHTWNNLDGQESGETYYRGIGWYRKHCMVDKGLAGRHFFLKFDGASFVADVYVNGSFIGEHQAGFSAFGLRFRDRRVSETPRKCRARVAQRSPPAHRSPR